MLHRVLLCHVMFLCVALGCAGLCCALLRCAALCCASFCFSHASTNKNSSKNMINRSPLTRYLYSCIPKSALHSFLLINKSMNCHYRRCRCNGRWSPTRDYSEVRVAEPEASPRQELTTRRAAHARIDSDTHAQLVNKTHGGFRHRLSKSHPPCGR